MTVDITSRILHHLETKHEMPKYAQHQERRRKTGGI